MRGVVLPGTVLFRFPLTEVDGAYPLFTGGTTGKVIVTLR